MYDSVRPHRRQPTRLCHPWASPGKNTGVGCHFLLQCMKVKSQSEVAQSCPTLSDPMDCSLPGSSVHGIFQARIPEWVAISFSRRSSRPRDWTRVSHIIGRRFTIWATREAHEHWSEEPIPSPGDLPDLGIGQGLLHGRMILYWLSYQGGPWWLCFRSDSCLPRNYLCQKDSNLNI